jgi:hypothetical protein
VITAADDALDAISDAIIGNNIKKLQPNSVKIRGMRRLGRNNIKKLQHPRHKSKGTNRKHRNAKNNSNRSYNNGNIHKRIKAIPAPPRPLYINADPE